MQVADRALENSLGQRRSRFQTFTSSTHVILAEITVSGGLKEARKGQQTKAHTNASQKPLKSMVHFN